MSKHHKEQLCVNCNTPSPTCTWKYNLTPVEGWETDEDGYVKTCPLYEENTREKKEEVCTMSKYKAYDFYKKKRGIKNEQS